MQLVQRGEDRRAVVYGMEGLTLTPEEIAFFCKARPYGYILFARNCESSQQVKALTTQLREVSQREELPILIDQEGGRVARLRPPHWRDAPAAKIFADLYLSDPLRARQAAYCNAQLIGAELAALGITVDCAPLADIPVEGSHDIIGDRAYGTTAEPVIALGREMARGLKSAGVLPVLKHIPGHGRSIVDSHEDLPIVHATLDELQATDFKPFQALRNLPMGMTAHIIYSALDALNVATTSQKVITYIRERIGFDGLLFSDDLSMHALKGSFQERAERSLAAGCDVVLHCNGKMEEMREVDKGVSPLSNEAIRRSEKAWQGRQTVLLDTQAIGDAYATLMAML